jgi:hypothetical protein
MFRFRVNGSTMGFGMVGCQTFFPSKPDSSIQPATPLLISDVGYRLAQAPFDHLRGRSPLLPLEDTDPWRFGGDHVPELPPHPVVSQKSRCPLPRVLSHFRFVGTGNIISDTFCGRHIGGIHQIAERSENGDTWILRTQTGPFRYSTWSFRSSWIGVTTRYPNLIKRSPLLLRTVTYHHRDTLPWK